MIVAAASTRSVVALIGALSLASAGCDSAEHERRAYETIWVSSQQANPVVTHIGAGDPHNLLDSNEFKSKRRQTVPDAITDTLKLQMRSHGIEPTLKGLIATLTSPLKAADGTRDADIERSKWLLGMRNTFWSGSPNKTAEIHSGNAGELLVLRHGDRNLVTCYVEENGTVAEYIYFVDGE